MEAFTTKQKTQLQTNRNTKAKVSFHSKVLVLFLKITLCSKSNLHAAPLCNQCVQELCFYSRVACDNSRIWVKAWYLQTRT